MSKQKTRNTKPSVQTEAPKRPRLRNVKVTSAASDDPIYSVGFVVGGKRLQGPKQTESKSQKQPTKDPEVKIEEILPAEWQRTKPKP
jgi:hypothetical protein